MVQLNVTIVATGQPVSGSPQFATIEQANAWIALKDAECFWGRPARSVDSNDPAIRLEDISKAISSSIKSSVTDPQTQVVTEVLTYNFAADYTTQIVDITAQVNQDRAIIKGLKAQVLGSQIVATVWAINENNSTLTTEEFAALLADPTLQQIERLLWNGSLKTARAMIAALPTTYFSADQISQILSIIDSSGLI